MNERTIREIEYVTEQSLSLLRVEVENMIRIGWEPFGNVVIDSELSLGKYIQAMVSFDLYSVKVEHNE